MLPARTAIGGYSGKDLEECLRVDHAAPRVPGSARGSVCQHIPGRDTVVKSTGKRYEDKAGVVLPDAAERIEGIRRQRDFYEALLTAQSDVGEGLLVVEDQRIRYVNEAFCLISGYSAAELMALPALLELIVPNQRRQIDDRMRRRLRGDAVENRYEIAILHKSGRRVDLEVAVRSLQREDCPPQLVVISRDITERKQLEERLKSSLGMLVAVHEAGRVMSSTLELEEIGTRLLEVMRRVSDLRASAIYLRDESGRLRRLRAFEPEILGRAASATPEARAARRGALETRERRLFRLGEGDTPLVGLYLPLVVRDRVIGVLEAYGPEALAEKTTVNTLEGLTHQVASALENARLYQRVAERERQLQNLVGKLLVAQEEERRRVACDIHDGLTQVAIAAHQHLQAYAEDHPPGCQASQRMDRILELSEQTVEEARRVIADLRPMALDDLGLATALRSWVDSLREEGWEIDYEEALGRERLPAEIETVLYRVAQEALTNVRKHARTTRVRITLRRLGGSVYLEVRDWGRGFDGAVEGGAPGERVGLCGMRERVALLGGEFRIQSQSGAGTSVVAEIPLLPAVPVHEEPSPRRGASPAARLVVADDQAIVREGLRTMLAGEPGFEVVGEAADGREALDLCRKLQPDLVLMDVRMPGMDGLAATRAIKSAGCATGILMLSTYENPDYLFEAVRAGASGYVVKDAPERELIGAIRGALGGENPLNQRLAMQLLRRLAGERERGSSPEQQAEPLSEPLTPREVEVLRFLARGQTNRQISRQLVVSPATVKVHVEHILAKLGVSDRTQAAVRASETGLLNPSE